MYLKICLKFVVSCLKYLVCKLFYISLDPRSCKNFSGKRNLRVGRLKSLAVQHGILIPYLFLLLSTSHRPLLVCNPLLHSPNNPYITLIFFYLRVLENHFNDFSRMAYPVFFSRNALQPFYFLLSELSLFC